MVFVAVSEVAHAEVLEEPGAKMSTQVPKFEKEERASLEVVEPTVIAAAVRAGETLQAFWFSLPAATAKTTPALIAPLTAESSAEDAPPPRLMFATAGSTRFCATQLTPEMTPEVVPEPWQLSTRTARRLTLFATP